MINKKELIRIVKNKDGSFSLDETGKKSGRGAYVCRKIRCLEKACRSKGLERSFRCSVPPDIYEKLKEEMVKYNE